MSDFCDACQQHHPCSCDDMEKDAQANVDRAREELRLARQELRLLSPTVVRHKATITVEDIRKMLGIPAGTDVTLSLGEGRAWTTHPIEVLWETKEERS